MSVDWAFALLAAGVSIMLSPFPAWLIKKIAKRYGR